MADTTTLVFARDVVFAPLKQLLLESFGPVWGGGLLPNCTTAAEECFSGAAGTVYPFAFNDIHSTSEVRVSKLQFFWYAEPANFQAIWLHGLPFSFRVAQRG